MSVRISATSRRPIRRQQSQSGLLCAEIGVYGAERRAAFEITDRAQRKTHPRLLGRPGGIGIGGEQPIGGTFVAEVWPEDRRKMGAGYMHTGYYFGFFLAALANYFIGANFGWRWMFVLGGAPALFVSWIRRGVRESEAWQRRLGDSQRRPAMGQAFAELFSPRYRRRTIVLVPVFLVSIVGLWAGSIYVPTAVTQISLRQGHAAADAARLASYGTGLLSIGTILGCWFLP